MAETKTSSKSDEAIVQSQVETSEGSPSKALWRRETIVFIAAPVSPLFKKERGAWREAMRLERQIDCPYALADHLPANERQCRKTETEQSDCRPTVRNARTRPSLGSRVLSVRKVGRKIVTQGIHDEIRFK